MGVLVTGICIQAPFNSSSNNVDGIFEGGKGPNKMHTKIQHIFWTT